jgi:RNA polymerase sigma factor (sigma-70 family)
MKLLAALGRDPGVFGELVRVHQSRVRNFLRRLARDDAAADDLAQETFIKAWEKLDSFTGQGSFGAWLMKIAYNQFLQSRRKARQDQRLDQQAQVEMLAGQSPTHAYPPSAESSDLDRLLAVCTEPERQVLTLAYGFGMSHGEIVEITGMALGTVKSHINRGKTRVRDQYAPGESGYD